MTLFLRPVLLVAIALFGAFPAVADEPPAEKVRVQVVLRHTGDPLRVQFQSKGSIAGGLLVPFFALGNMARADARNDKFNEAVGSYPRGQVLLESFERLFPSKYTMFAAKAVIDAPAHASDAELVRQARDGGFRYVLLVDEQFAGLSSGGFVAQDDKVVVVINEKVQLFDATNGSSLFTTKLFSNTVARESLATATASGDFFRANFPMVADAFVGRVVGELLRTDNLHAMAASIGQGDQVPALASVLNRYSGPIRITPKAPSGWHVIDLNTPYAKSVEPKSKLKFKLGVRFDVDLLVNEFGQNVTTIEDYVAAASVRYAELGFDISTLAPYQGGALADLPGYTAYSMRRKDGTGGQVMYFKLLEKPYLAMKTVVATEDLDGLLAANRAAIEKALSESGITIGTAD